MSDILTKAKAREVLLRNFGSLQKAKEKLDDKFLITAFEAKGMPVTKKVITYLDKLNYNTVVLYNVCSDCGITYTYHNSASTTKCRLCTHKTRYKDKMITEPANWDEYLHNLAVLRDYFDSEDDTTFADEIESVKVYLEAQNSSFKDACNATDDDDKDNAAGHDSIN